MIGQYRKNAFYDLIWRGNIITRNFRGKTIIIYEDHRYLLNILFYARIKGILKKIPNLIFFDKHDDANPPGQYLIQRIQNYQKQIPSLANFWQFVEFELSPYDDNWLKSGMEMALIQNAVIFGVKSWLAPQKIDHYTDSNNENHQIINGGDFGENLPQNSTLMNNLKEANFFHLLHLLDDQQSGQDPNLYLRGIRPFILDFDLDCFTYNNREGKLNPLTEDDFQNKIGTKINGQEKPSLNLIQKLAERASFITIAKESDYCGGIRESNRILELLDQFIFEGSIMTNFSS